MKTTIIDKQDDIIIATAEIPPCRRTIQYKQQKYFVNFDFTLIFYYTIFNYENNYVRFSYPHLFGIPNGVSLNDAGSLYPIIYPHVGPQTGVCCYYLNSHKHESFNKEFNNSLEEMLSTEQELFWLSPNEFYMYDDFMSNSREFEHPKLNLDCKINKNKILSMLNYRKTQMLEISNINNTLLYKLLLNDKLNIKLAKYLTSKCMEKESNVHFINTFASAIINKEIIDNILIYLNLALKHKNKKDAQQIINHLIKEIIKGVLTYRIGVNNAIDRMIKLEKIANKNKYKIDYKHYHITDERMPPKLKEFLTERTK